jgi:DNA mismatch repair protein MutS
MDETRCAMGKRLLKRRLLHPLRDLGRIQARLDMVETLYHNQASLSSLRNLLGKTPDLERLCSRLAMDKAHGKDMLAIKNALISCEEVRELTETLTVIFEEKGNGEWGVGSGDQEGNLRPLVSVEDRTSSNDTASDLHSDSSNKDTASGSYPDSSNKNPYSLLPTPYSLPSLKDLLERGICEEPSIVLSEGNLIREGYSSDLDSLRRLRDSGRQLLEEYLEEEKKATGIPSLKIRYNRLIGYFFEVTKVHLDRVPKYFIRRQGVVGGERFSTERLAALESDINGASDRIVELERRLFLEIREKAKTALGELAVEARRLAELDVAQSLARAASIRGWVRPVVDTSNALEIYEARHPVVEAHLGKGEYIPNDIILNSGPDSPSFAMITGPNMAGKSTYLRSAALITLMAQTGSFIPAREGRIGLCDRIYCRVGASDNLARGESTFLVEMNETAYILNTATEKSLVIMDEVGRGTGTNDGLSIAWAVSEELLGRVKCRTFFATHYHELSLLPHPRVVNRSMEVDERDGGVIFLRRLKEGPSAESYGIHVARLAGLSQAVLERAQAIMERLRERDTDLRKALPQALPSGQENVNRVDNAVNNADGGTVNRQATEVYKRSEILDELRKLNTDGITPLTALNLINEWKKRLATEGYVSEGGKKSVRQKSRGDEVRDSALPLFE